jgi:predicted AlkP superfamily pyrophosphatase or phosphodiesterase
MLEYRMSRLLASVTLPILLSLGGLYGQEATQAKQVILISVDGLRPAFYLDRLWPAPMMQQMAREGPFAQGVVGVFPSVTYPSHTSIITGAQVAKHGIFNNTDFESGRWHFEYGSIRTPTLWDAATEAGMITASVGWPVTLHAPIDYNVPVSGALQNSGLVEDPIRAFTTPGYLFAELERRATGLMKQGDLANSNPSKEGRVAEMVAFILREYSPGFVTVALQHTDSYQHTYGLDHPRVHRAVAAADRAISRIVEAVEELGMIEQTTFIITGDHGFVQTNAEVAPNVWLSEAGYRSRDLVGSDWKAAFEVSGGSAFLHLRDPSDQEAVEKIRGILAALSPAVRSLFTVHDRDELDRLGAAPHVHLALSGIPGIAMSSAAEGSCIRYGAGATHGHHPEMPEMHTGFIAWGRSVRRGTIVPKMHLVDIAPLVAQLLGLRMDSADGVLIPGLLEQSQFQR